MQLPLGGEEMAEKNGVCSRKAALGLDGSLSHYHISSFLIWLRGKEVPPQECVSDVKTHLPVDTPLRVTK